MLLKATTLEDMDAIVGIVPKPPVKLQVPVEPTSLEDDIPELDRLHARFERAGKTYGVPPEILAAIASRESRVGQHLNKEGYDPEKKAYGVMQIDERYHKRRGRTPDSQAHINQAAEILSKNKKEIDKRFPKWSEEQRMQAAVAAYNMGSGNVKTWKNLDVGTTGGNYSADVMNRAKVLLTTHEKRDKDARIKRSLKDAELMLRSKAIARLKVK
jgi:membrane-bound lytic murein transglycosylase MltF